jgi:hyperosmotically inducible protein
MNTPANTLALLVAVALGASVLATGCNRQESASSNMAPSTSVGVDIDDTVVTTKVKSALVDDSIVKGFDIKVETRKGVVQLSGFVDNRTQIDRAVSVARGVEGVKSVDNAMTLKEGQLTVGNQIDDGVITANVKSALLADKDVKSFDIGVVTRKGEVQLSGYVDSQAQVDHAIEVTRSVAGVSGVVNEMSIKR